MKKICISFLSLFISLNSFAQDYERSEKSFRETLSALVKANTTNPPGNEAKAVEILGARLKQEGIPFQTMEFGPGRANLVARLKGTGELRPLLLLAHTDVVGVQNQEWTVPPHEVTEKDGFLYGRGVNDDLGMAVVNLETFIALKRQGAKLRRDVILAYTGDEESGGSGIVKLIEAHPDWIDAEIALNEGGRIVTGDNGKPSFVGLVVAEKTYQDFTLSVKGATGHSSIPKGDNAIALLAQAIDRVSKYKPKERLLPAVREYFAKRAEVEKPDIKNAMRLIAQSKGPLPKSAVKVIESRPSLAPQIFTTCVPTMISGGSRVNALPPEASANINCRILPDEPVPNVQRRLEQVIDDPRIQVVKAKDFTAGGASDIKGVIPDAVNKVVKKMWGKIPVISSLQFGGTDSRYLRIRNVQAYGLNPIAGREDDFSRSHGVDERISVAAIRPGLEFQYLLVTELAGIQ